MLEGEDETRHGDRRPCLGPLQVVRPSEARLVLAEPPGIRPDRYVGDQGQPGVDNAVVLELVVRQVRSVSTAKNKGGKPRSRRARSRSTVVIAFSQGVATLQLPMKTAELTRSGSMESWDADVVLRVLPSGFVTLCFIDFADSTGFLRLLGNERYQELLEVRVRRPSMRWCRSPLPPWTGSRSVGCGRAPDRPDEGRVDACRYVWRHDCRIHGRQHVDPRWVRTRP